MNLACVEWRKRKKEGRKGGREWGRKGRRERRREGGREVTCTLSFQQWRKLSSKRLWGCLQGGVCVLRDCETAVQSHLAFVLCLSVFLNFCPYLPLNLSLFLSTHTHTHLHTYISTYVLVSSKAEYNLRLLAWLTTESQPKNDEIIELGTISELSPAPPSLYRPGGECYPGWHYPPPHD